MRLKELTKHIFEGRVKSTPESSTHAILEDTELFEVSFRDAEHEQEVLNAPIECGFEVEMIWTKKLSKVKSLKITEPEVRKAFKNNKLDELYTKYPKVFTSNNIKKINTYIQDRYPLWVDSIYHRDIKRQAMASIRDEESDKYDEGINKFIDTMMLTKNFKDEIKYLFSRQASKSEKTKPIDYHKWGKRYLGMPRYIVTPKSYSSYSEQPFISFIEKNPKLFPGYQEILEKEKKKLTLQKFFKDNEECYDFVDFLISEDLVDDPYYQDDEAKDIENLMSYMNDDWIKPSSSVKEVTLDFSGVNSKAWHFHMDSSVGGGGEDSLRQHDIPVEISSPVFPTPNIMLTELASLLTYMRDNKVKTNDTTGLHVTMSYRGAARPLNKVKMVLLLNDKYWLEKFNRQDNEYTASQLDRILPNVNLNKAMTLKDTQLKQIENLIKPTISTDKYYAIHFKQLANIDKNKLVEFRILGNKGYEQQYDEVKKAVTQYAGVMEAGYNPEAFKEEYNEELRKILKLIAQSTSNLKEFDTLIKRLIQSTGDAPREVKRGLQKYIEGTVEYLFLFHLLEWLSKGVINNKIKFSANDQKVFASVLAQKGHLNWLTDQLDSLARTPAQLNKVKAILGITQ